MSNAKYVVVHKQSDGGIKAHDSLEAAEADAAERNERAKRMGLTAAYYGAKVE